MIPVTVLVMTKNEGENLAHCLLPLISRFERVIVVDSNSDDDTVEIAKSMNVDVMKYIWGGGYPKKRQWCIENLYGLGPWVFFVDADEIVTPDLTRELQLLFARGAHAEGYFVKSAPYWLNKRLRFGMKNNKLCLFRTDSFAFPPVNDLDIPGMGEIEGHYQPVRIKDGARVGQIGTAMTHHNRKGRGAWLRKHDHYAAWEAEMVKRDAFPIDPIAWRQDLKKATRAFWLRPWLVFFYSYIFKLGFLDGVAGLDYAIARKNYARLVLRRLRSPQ
ncbi:MAG TPA: glycosyltransferase family 2 protein [Alphaproteobacteria bacterium]